MKSYLQDTRSQELKIEMVSSLVFMHVFHFIIFMVKFIEY